jgi:hypothetical protein
VIGDDTQQDGPVAFGEERPMDREFDPLGQLSGLFGDYSRVVEKLVRLGPEGRIDDPYVEGAMDPGRTYAKLMATFVQFWLAPDEVIKEGLRRSPNSERSFDLLWLAYEQWYSRGFNHVAQISAELSTFYKNLRWILVNNRNDPHFVENLDNFVAEASQAYLERVQDLTKENFKLYDESIKGVLQKLKTLRHEMEETPKGTNAVSTVSTGGTN